MKTLYLDIFSGISGDMFVGALLDLGVNPAQLNNELLKLDLQGYHIHIERKEKSAIEGIKFDVHLHEHHEHHGHEGHSHGDHEHQHSCEAHSDAGHSHAHTHHSEPGSGGVHSHEHTHEHGHGHHHEPAADHSHGPDEHHHGRNFADIKSLIHQSTLSDWVKEKSVAVFQRIAVAEGKVHGLPADQVHFHEVGAVDSIIDIVAACVALEALDKPRVLAAAATEGTGWIQCAHGRFPIPAPATLQILGARGIPLTQCEEPHELITPTGAALLAEFVECFGPMKGLVAEKVGFGLGTRDNKTRPNVLRAILGESVLVETSAHDWETDTVAVLETNLDDISPEILGYFVERALTGGALDVFHTSIQMKKNRPGVLLTVLCPENQADFFTELMLRETTAFGVRRSLTERRKLRREFVIVSTPHGKVSVKLGRLNGRVVQVAPEFESCKAVAQQAGVPVKQVFEEALRQWDKASQPN